MRTSWPTPISGFDSQSIVGKPCTAVTVTSCPAGLGRGASNQQLVRITAWCRPPPWTLRASGTLTIRVTSYAVDPGAGGADQQLVRATAMAALLAGGTGGPAGDSCTFDLGAGGADQQLARITAWHWHCYVALRAGGTGGPAGLTAARSTWASAAPTTSWCALLPGSRKQYACKRIRAGFSEDPRKHAVVH